MLDTQSDYALNKIDKTAIVCPSVTGEHVRLTREDFSSEEEFLLWKGWSDDDYHKIELDGRKDDDCLSFEAQKDTPSPSAENVLLTSLSDLEKAIQRASLREKFEKLLTPLQIRRMQMYYIQHLGTKEIAVLEGVSHQAVSLSLRTAKQIIVNNL